MVIRVNADKVITVQTIQSGVVSMFFFVFVGYGRHWANIFWNQGRNKSVFEVLQRVGHVVEVWCSTLHHEFCVQ